MVEVQQRVGIVPVSNFIQFIRNINQIRLTTSLFLISDSCQRIETGGWYNAFSNLEDCYVCPKGFYDDPIDNEQRSCKPCGRGLFGATTKATSVEDCTACIAGRFSDADGYDGDSSAGITECEHCEPGKWSDATGAAKESVCKNCPAGTYSTDIAATSVGACIECKAGTYLDVVGADTPEACTDCIAGYSQNLEGAAFCLPCIQGKSQVLKGQNECVDCLENEYSTNGIACLSCPSGRSSNKGSSSCKTCVKGTKIVGGGRSNYTCEVCPAGQISQQGEEQCTDCSAGFYSDSSGKLMDWKCFSRVFCEI